MPLLSIDNSLPDIKIGIWYINEDIKQLIDNYPELSFCFDILSNQYKSIVRIREKLVVRALLIEMFSNEDHIPQIFYSEEGMPMLDNGYNISITHTREYAAAIISHTRKVGIDIEMVTDRVNKVVSHFARIDENADTLVKRWLIWCAKETLYKLKPLQHLQTSEMRTKHLPKTVHGIGKFKIEDMQTGEIHDVYYCVNSDYVLTYTF